MLVIGFDLKSSGDMASPEFDIYNSYSSGTAPSQSRFSLYLAITTQTDLSFPEASPEDMDNALGVEIEH
jgi:hypothetical protein